MTIVYDMELPIETAPKADCTECGANFRLAAAAPKMLLALKRLVNDSMYKDHPEASQMAIASIAEAEGAHSGG